MKDFIQYELSRIDAVERVFVEQDGQFFYVTTVINEPEDAVLDRILEAQERIIGCLKEYGFDFNVLFRMGRREEELVSAEEPIFKRA